MEDLPPESIVTRLPNGQSTVAALKRIERWVFFLSNCIQLDSSDTVIHQWVNSFEQQKFQVEVSMDPWTSGKLS